MINLANVSYFYRKKKVLDSISLSISKGDFFCFVGVNGSGKTTLLRSIANLIDFEGDITFLGENIRTISKKEFAKKVAFMEQVKSTNIPYTVRDIVSFARFPYKKKSLFGETSPEDISICERAIENVGLSGVMDKYLSEISGGQQQRVFIAQIFAQDPEILILDEPTTFLDLRYKIEVLDIVKKWANENKKTIICTLHDLEFVLKYGTKTALLDRGKVLKIDTPKNVIFSEEMTDCYRVDIKKFFNDRYYEN